MSEPADFKLEQGVLALTGDWTSMGLGRAAARLQREARAQQPTSLDLSGLGRFDTAGAFEVFRSAGAGPDTPGLEARPDARRLVALVAEATPAKRVSHRRFDPVYALLTRAGRGVHEAAKDIVGTFAFYGRLMVTLLQVARDPRRIRIAPTVSLMERAGLDALPIVVATNFFVGATLAFLGADLLATFGASVFTVEMIGVGVLREFGVLHLRSPPNWAR